MLWTWDFSYGGDALPRSWQANLFFAALRDRHLHRVILQPPEYTTVQAQEKLFAGTFGRLRDVVQGPEGFLYLATSNRDGRGTPAPQDDRLLRIVPAR